MNPFRSLCYDQFKDRRYGTLFFGTLLGLPGIFAASWLFLEWIGWQNYIQPFLLSGCILTFVLGWRLIRRARKNQRERSKFAALSRDEVRVARSKLRNGSSPVIHPLVRVPDTDLKY